MILKKTVYVGIIVCFALFIYVVYFQSSVNSSDMRNLSFSINSTDKILNISKLNNVTTIEIQLKNSEQHPETNYTTIIVPAVSAVSAGIIGAYFTYRYGVMKERNKELEFKTSIIAITAYELKKYHEFILRILSISEKLSEKSDPNIKIIRDESELRKSRSTLLGFSNQYSQMTIEKKASVFKADTLVQIESIYERFHGFEFKPRLIGTVKVDGCFYYSDLDDLRKDIEGVLAAINNSRNKSENI